MGYGFFCGGDPRKFHPDLECSTEAERAKHKADCEAWDRGEMPNVNDKAPHFRVMEGGGVMHVIPGGYGLGSYDDDDEDEPDESHPYSATCDCEDCYDARMNTRSARSRRGPQH